MSDDFSYYGSGQAYLRKVGAAAPMLAVGNATALDFGVTEDVKTLLDRTKPGGGLRNEVRRISSVDFSATLTDLSAANLAIALLGDVTQKVAGNAANEPVVGYKGGLIPLANVASAITTVKSGADDLDAGTDFILQDGGLWIPEGSTIEDGDNLTVSYSFGASALIQAVNSSAGEYEFYFPGFNEAREDKRFTIRAWRVRIGATDKLSLITDDFGNLNLKGSVLADDSKPAGISRYFTAELEL